MNESRISKTPPVPPFLHHTPGLPTIQILTDTLKYKHHFQSLPGICSELQLQYIELQNAIHFIYNAHSCTGMYEQMVRKKKKKWVLKAIPLTDSKIIMALTVGCLHECF